MAPPLVSSTLLKSISRFTSCDVGDALVKLKVRHGGFLAGLKMFSPQYCGGSTKICGPAHTVRMVDAADTKAPRPSKHFADSITPGSVVFVSQPRGNISACWGGLMSTRARKLGAAGVLIDGRFRDMNEHRELDMALFARGCSILGSNTFTRSSEINVPVDYEIEEMKDRITVQPGDIIIGDADGVVAIPAELVADCVNLCEERARIDGETLRLLNDGEEMGPTIAKLRK